MASPLLAYANSLVRTSVQGAVTMVNGRPTAAVGSIYVIRCYIQRQQYSGVTSGSKKLPLESQLEGRMLPGASGDQVYYRGYALQKAVVSGGVDWLGNISSLTFTQVTAQETFLLPGKEIDLKFGNEVVLDDGIKNGQRVAELALTGENRCFQVAGPEVECVATADLCQLLNGGVIARRTK